MRPFITFTGDALASVTYGFERAEEVVGGTIPSLAPDRIAAVLTASAPKGVRMGTSVLHITLSAPEGVRLPRQIWQSVIKHVLVRLGVNPETHPWIAFRHSDKNCDHVHVPVSRTDFFGLPGAALPRDLDVLCSEIHRDLALRLGFVAPDYPVLSPHPRLQSRAPKRRDQKPLVAALHAAVGKILVEQRPDTVEELAECLPTPFELKMKGNHPAFQINGRPVPVADLKPDLTSQAVLSRVSHVRAVRRALGILREMSFVSRFLDTASRAILSRLKKDLANDHRKPDRTAGTLQGHLRSEPVHLAQAGRNEAAPGHAVRVEGPRDGSGTSGPGRGLGGNRRDDTRHPSSSVDVGVATEGNGRHAFHGAGISRPDGASPSLTFGDWAADLWAAALRLVDRPSVVFGRQPGRATVRFSDATRVEVEGTDVTLGHVGSGDLATPREFATVLSQSNAVWVFDAALIKERRQFQKPGRARDAFVLSDLDFNTLRRARQILGLSVADPSPLFLAADDPAIHDFPDAPLLSTRPERDPILAMPQSAPQFPPLSSPPEDKLPGVDPGVVAELSEPAEPENVDAGIADPEDSGPDPF